MHSISKIMTSLEQSKCQINMSSLWCTPSSTNLSTKVRVPKLYWLLLCVISCFLFLVITTLRGCYTSLRADWTTGWLAGWL